MRFLQWLFHLDGIVPYKVSHRRARSIRAIAVVVLIAAFPGAFITYHQGRLQPVVNSLTEHIQEVAEQRFADEPK